MPYDVTWLLQDMGEMLRGMAPLFIIFIIFWFLFFRPQMKERKNQQAMRAALKKGDRVVTQGGIVAAIHSLKNEREVVLDLQGNARMTVLRDAIISVIPGGKGASEKKDAAAKESSASA